MRVWQMRVYNERIFGGEWQSGWKFLDEATCDAWIEQSRNGVIDSIASMPDSLVMAHQITLQPEFVYYAREFFDAPRCPFCRDHFFTADEAAAHLDECLAERERMRIEARTCDECGAVHDTEEEADDCCRFLCIHCEREYTTEDEAADCCVYRCPECGYSYEGIHAEEEARECCYVDEDEPEYVGEWGDDSGVDEDICVMALVAPDSRPGILGYLDAGTDFGAVFFYQRAA